jgi:type VI protein secretion system component Hcp
MDRQRLGFAGLTVAAAAAVGTLTAAGAGSAASGATGAARSHGVAKVVPALKASRPGLKARAATESTAKLYLSIPGVPGEVSAAGPYTNQIEMYSYSWGMSNPNVGAGGKATLSSVNLQGAYDRSTPPLETMSETGKTTTATLTEVDSQSRKIRTQALTGVRVDSLSIGTASGGTAAVSLSLSFTQEASYYYYYGASGTATTYRSCWNVTSQSTC